MKNKGIIGKLIKNHSLSLEEYEFLIKNHTEADRALLSLTAQKICKSIYENKIFIRGLIEISNICKNDCYYCGIRKSNSSCLRYRLNKDEILGCVESGYLLGFRTFVLQGGEDAYFNDQRLIDIITHIKKMHGDVAVTLSLGERSCESYKKLFSAGADRYLLRHETATKEHYCKLHPKELSFDNRMECLKNLSEIGYQAGAGFMVGSPFQTPGNLATDLKYIENTKPDMCGIGPFIPHRDTPFKDYPAGSAELTCFLLSVIRIIHPKVLLPATTALSTAKENGRIMGILSGANVVMPNISPQNARENYQLYNGKLSSGTESAEGLNNLKEQLKKIGYEIVTDRGDIKK